MNMITLSRMAGGFSLGLLCLCASQKAATSGSSLPVEESRSGQAGLAAPQALERVTGYDRGDTILYDIVFNSREERTEFLRSFEALYSRYSFDTLSPSAQIHLLVKAGPERPATEAAIRHPDSVAVPPVKGHLTIYADRGFVDRTFATLVEAAQSHENPDSVTIQGLPPEGSCFPVSQVSARKIVVQLADGLVGINGKPVSAYDMVNAWSRFVRERPAEGMAIFRHVKGIESYIQGKETVVPGFSVVDEKSIAIILDKNDSTAMVRLSTARLSLPDLGLGPYGVLKTESGRMFLTAGISCDGRRGFCERLTLVLGGDKNPVVAYSLKRYDAVTLLFSRDVEAARRALRDSASLHLIGRDRYFLSLASPDDVLRRYVAFKCRGSTVLGGLPKIEAHVISRLFSADSLSSPTPDDVPAPPPPKDPLSIICMAADTLSVHIADRLVALLGKSGVPCRRTMLEITQFQRTLLSRQYDIAIGFTPSGVLTDPAQQQIAASQWFNDVADENERIASAQEVPLFAVQRYLLCRKGVDLFGGTLDGIFVR